MLNITKDFYRQLNKQVKEVQTGSLSTFSYLHGGLDFSDRRLRLARGLTLDENDNIVLVGFEKFFCNNQLSPIGRDWVTEEFAEEYSKLQDSHNKFECIEKLDGTMVILGVYQGQLITSTTSSIDNDYSNKALAYFNQLPFKDDLIEYLENRNSCFVFEYISPDNRIKVFYKDSDYVLLSEISKDELSQVDIENDFEFTRPHIYYYSYNEILDIQKNAEDIEGFVVKNDYGHLIKLKTNWWYESANLNQIFFGYKFTKANVEDIVDAYFNDEIDELYSIQNSNAIYKEAGKVDKVVSILEEMQEICDKMVDKYKSPKEFALSEDAEKCGLYRGIVISKIKGTEVPIDIYKRVVYKVLKERELV